MVLYTSALSFLNGMYMRLGAGAQWLVDSLGRTGKSKQNPVRGGMVTTQTQGL